MVSLRQCVDATLASPAEASKIFADLTYTEVAPIDLLRAGIEIKESAWSRGGLRASEDIFSLITSLYPSYGPGFYELAVAQRYQGKLREALFSICEASKHSDAFTIKALKAHLIAAAGETEQAQKLALALSPSKDSERLYAENIYQFAEYVREFPHSRGLYLIDELRRQHYWAAADQAVDRLRDAVVQQRPFALVRLGDGEGAYARVNDLDEVKYAGFYKNIRAYWKDFLMGPSFEPGWSGFNDLTFNLMSIGEEADLTGLPYNGWVDFEYKTASLTTIPCLVNINRWYLNNVSRAVTLCDQDIHSKIQQAGRFHEIISMAKGVTVISCHAKAAEVVSQMFDVKDVDLIQVPSESRAPHLHKVGGVNNHFPSRFWEVNSALSHEHSGRVFIIAAGIFGKYYSIIAKRYGGIGIDVGSMLDVWMNIVSRGGYRELFNIK